MTIEVLRNRLAAVTTELASINNDLATLQPTPVVLHDTVPGIQGIGRYVAMDFEVLKQAQGTFVFKGEKNKTLMANKSILVDGKRRAVIWVENTVDCIIENLLITAPHNTEWYFNWHADTRQTEPVLIAGRNNINLQIRDVNLFGGYRGIHMMDSAGTVIQKAILGRQQRHAIMIHGERPLSDRGAFIEDVYAYHAQPGDALHTSGSTDTISFYNCLDPTDGKIPHRASNLLVEGGFGQNGSGVIVDGKFGNLPGGVTDPMGGVEVDHVRALDSSNVAVCISKGRNNRFSLVRGFKGRYSPNAGLGSAYKAALIYDFKSGQPDRYWANNRIEHMRTNWYVTHKGKTQRRGPLPPLTIDTGYGYGHPASTAEYIDCDFDATDLNRQVVRKNAIDDLDHIPCFVDPATSDNYFVDLY